MSLANKASIQKRKRVLNKKNNTHQVSHLFPFPSQNESVFFISNINLHNDQKAVAENALSQTKTIDLEDIKIESRVFPVLTKTNGFPRLIQEVKINLGKKVLTLTNMTTNLKPSALTDEYFSQIVSTLSPPNFINEYKIDLNEDEGHKTEEEWRKFGRAEGHISNEKKEEPDNVNLLIVNNDEKNQDLANTLVHDRPDEEGMKKLFTVKKKISKAKEFMC